MRSAEWLGEVDQRGRRSITAGTDLPLQFRIPYSALRIRRRPPVRPPIRSALPPRTVGGADEPAPGDSGDHRRLRRALRRAAARDARGAQRAHLASGLEPWLATPH